MQRGFDSTLSYVLFVPTQKENMNVHDVPRGDAAAPQRLCSPVAERL